MDFGLMMSFGFSVAILIDGIQALARNTEKKARTSGGLALITGILFIAASIIGAVRINASSDMLLLMQWILYIVGFVIYIIALVIRKKAPFVK